jgi:Zn-dependent peptidase ImmA (M78 family)
MKYMTPESVKQYQIEERSLIAGRMKAEKVKLDHLLDCMKADVICIEENLVKLRKDLAKHYHNKEFLECKNMGEVVELSLKMVNLH